MAEELSLSEESAIFFLELGRAMAGWSRIEDDLLTIASICYGDSNFRLLREGFYAVDNMRAKTAFVDAAVTVKFAGTPHLADWGILKPRVDKWAAQRNMLAHHPTFVYHDAPAGRRYALVPRRPPEDTHPSQDGPPAGSKCLRDVAQVRARFEGASHTLRNFAVRLLGKPAPPLEPAEPEGKTPTLARLRRQSYAALSTPPRSLRGKVGSCTGLVFLP